MSLFYGDLVDTCLMTSSFESGVEEFGHDLVGGCCIDKSSGHYEHIGVIVLAGKPGDFGDPAECGAYSLVFVEGHADSFSTSADGDARIAFACFYGFGQRVSEVGIVAAGG